MLQTTIPKDIRKYEAKLVGPFSTRQTILFVIACVIAYITQGLFKNTIACFIAASPAIAFGWVKVYGQSLEQFIKSAFISNFVAPNKRKYKTVNTFRSATDDFKPIADSQRKKMVKKYKKLAKTNPNYIAYK